MGYFNNISRQCIDIVIGTWVEVGHYVILTKETEISIFIGTLLAILEMGDSILLKFLGNRLTNKLLR